MDRHTRDLANYVINMVKRAGVVLMAKFVAGDLPRAQMTALHHDVKDDVPILMPYGICYRVNPATDSGAAETVIIAIGPDHNMALPPADRRYIPGDLVDGELIIYTAEDEGAPFRIKFGAGRQLSIEAADAVVNITGDITLNIDGNATINAGDTARIDADKVRIRSTSSTIIECNGRGFELKPDREHTWTEGSVAGTSNPINAPEVPES